jgi:adenosylhomocysteinase
VPALDTLLKDPGLAPEGRRKIDFAASRMPVLGAVAAELARTRPLAGQRIVACPHVTTETANLCRALIAGGAELALCASNPLSTKDDVAAAIHEELGAAVFAVHGADHDTFHRQVDGVLGSRPTLLVDDGADLTATVHTRRRDLLAGIAGATEVTSTGMLRARNMAREGVLAYPLLAVNDAATKHLFDNRYGTGQSTIDGILRATNVLLAGKVVVVVGYGWCGRGVASRARGLGARVVVCEVDPLKALEAVMEGYQVLPVAEAARVGEVFVTVTGNRDALTLEHLQAMPPGAIVANAGHFDLEIDVAALRRARHRRHRGPPRRRRLHPAGRRSGHRAGRGPAGRAELRRGPPGRGHGPDLRHPDAGRGAAGHGDRPAPAGCAPGPGRGRGAGRPPQAGRPRGPLRRPHPRPAELPARLAARHLRPGWRASRIWPAPTPGRAKPGFGTTS